RDYAYALAKAERYDEALATLDLLRNPNTPEALNYRGYATRKLGRLDEGRGYYLKSVALAPRYAQVREYLGEAYVTKGDLASAQAQPHAIEGICGTGCEQYQHLAAAISQPAKLLNATPWPDSLRPPTPSNAAAASRRRCPGQVLAWGLFVP